MYFSKIHIFWTKKIELCHLLHMKEHIKNYQFLYINQKKILPIHVYIYLKKPYFQNFIDCPTVQFFEKYVFHRMRCYLVIYLSRKKAVIFSLDFLPFLWNFKNALCKKVNFWVTYDLKTLKIQFFHFFIFFSLHWNYSINEKT